MIKDLLNRLKYSKCDCPIDYKESIGVVNGKCPNHPYSKLMVDGVLAEARKALPKRKFDRAPKTSI